MGNPIVEAPYRNDGLGCGHRIGHEYHKDDQKLSSDDETFHIVSPMSQERTLVGKRMTYLEELLRDGLQTDEAALAALHFRQPKDENPKDSDVSKETCIAIKFGADRLSRDDRGGAYVNTRD